MTEQGTGLIYVRVSRLDAEEKDRKLSPLMQREKALALPELKGLALLFFEDIDISGKDTKNRPGYQGLMGRLAPDVKYVVAYDLSRTMRDLGDQQEFFKALQRNGTLFIDSSKAKTIDVSDEDEELLANIEGSVNMHARKKTSRRVRDTLASKVEHGDMVGPVPAGYLRRKEVLPSGRIARTWVELDPERAPTIRLVFKDYATGLYSYKGLAMSLNDRNIPLARPPHFRNNRAPARIWTADVLKDLLANPRYAGKVPRRDGRVFEARFPRMVDDETWAACVKARMQGRTKMSDAIKGPRRRSSVYLLTGVLRCARCGSSVSGERRAADARHSRARVAYVCYQRRVAKECDLPYLKQDKLEREMLSVLQALTLPDGLAEAVDAAIAAYLTDEQRSSRVVSLKSLEDRQRRLNEMYELGRIERVEYDERSAELAGQKARASSQKVKPLLIRQRTMLRTLVDDWDEMTLEERKRLIGLVFEQITADAEGLTGLQPREDWKPYMRAVVPATGGSERKTGLEPATLTLAR